MKLIIAFVTAVIILFSCNVNKDKAEAKQDALPIVGTWQLISGTLIDKIKGDTTVTDYTKGQPFIKIINGTHFAFLSHDLTKGKGPNPVFSAGGGRYTLAGDQYTEMLEYCNDRQWENNSFKFTVSVQDDTFTQKGIEKVDSIGVNRLNVERYVRVK